MAKGDGPKGKSASEAFEDGDKVKTIRDTKRGKAADDHQVPIEGKEGKPPPNFVPQGATLDEFLAKAAELEDEKEALKEKMRSKTEPERKKIADCNKTIKNAEDRLAGDGYGLKALQTLKRQYIARRKADRAIKELDEGQLKDHRAMEKAWKEFSAIPGGLGEAAERREAVH